MWYHDWHSRVISNRELQRVISFAFACHSRHFISDELQKLRVNKNVTTTSTLLTLSPYCYSDGILRKAEILEHAEVCQS